MLLLALAFACTHPAPPSAATDAATPDAGPVTLTIVAMNDFHGALYEQPVRHDPSTAMGGLPVLTGAVESLRAEDPDLLLLDGGDVFQGSWPVNQTNGRGAVEAFDLLGVDAGAIGNHEFDYGPGIAEDTDPLRGALEEGLAMSSSQWLSANIYQGDTRWQPDGLAPWTVIERKGVKVGIIGLTTTDTPQTTLLRHVEDLTFRDPVETVREAIPALEEAGADVTVVVGHLTGKCDPDGYFSLGEPCTPGGEIGRLLTELPEGTIDVIVAGHTHTLMAHRVGDTFLMENRAKGHALGRLDLVVGPDGVDHDASVMHEPWALVHDAVDPGCEDGTYALEPLDVGGRTVTPSADALALVERLEDEVGSVCDVVGCAARSLGRDRSAQSGVGDVVADLMREAFEGADLAVTNSGGLRADLPEGPLRREHLHAVMPFDNRLLLVELTGAQVEDMLRLGSSGAHGILQLSGGSYHFDPERTDGADRDGDGEVSEWERDRLCGAEIGGGAIDPDATYRVVTTDFLYEGGDHLGPVFEGAKVLEEGPLLRELLIERIEARHADDGACIGGAEPDVRIRVGACDVSE